MNDIRVLLADDHEIIRLGLMEFFSRLAPSDSEPGITVVDNYATADQLLASANRDDVDVFITDLGLEGTKGDIGIIKLILDANPAARIIVYSMRSKTPTIMGCYNAGAKGYVNKAQKLDELVNAIRVVAAGGDYYAPEALKSIGLNSIRDPLKELSDREKEIFLLIAQNVSIDELAVELGISTKRIKNIITERLRPTLGVTAKGFRELAIKLGLIEDL